MDLENTATLVGRRTWRPILHGEMAEAASSIIREIAEAVVSPPETWMPSIAMTSYRPVLDASIDSGHAGLAVFYSYLAEASETPLKESYSRIATKFLEQAIEAVSELPMRASLYGGFAGIAWATSHLEGRLFDPGPDDINEEIDELLLKHLGETPWQGLFDLAGGLVGLGVYALERLPRPSAVSCLELMIDRLAEIAVESPAGMTWFTPPSQLFSVRTKNRYPEGLYDLGVAHGVPGVIALLSEAYSEGVARPKARSLIEGAVAWLLAQRLPEEEGSRFSYAVGITQEKQPLVSRAAWCYGDAGVAITLLHAARSLDSQEWEDEALAIALHVRGRTLESAGVVDAGLCHGASGMGHIFNRLFQATRDERFAEAARFWFQHTIELRQPGRWTAGYFAVKPDGDEEYLIEDGGVLTGAAGIALALLAATTPVEPEWDRLLLTSVLPHQNED